MSGHVQLDDAIKCELVDQLADDLAVVNAARVSLDAESDWVYGDTSDDLVLKEGDARLVEWLMKKRHGSPFEHNFFKFRVEAPIFTFREHHRHRVGHSYNEMSGRYVELEPHFYLPEQARTQEGKPGAYVYVEHHPEDELSLFMRKQVSWAYEDAWWYYQRLLDRGIAKEQARMVLPVGIFTKMIWSVNARSLMHFIGLRAEKSAQQEIQVVARAAEQALAEHMPVTYAAFIANERVCP